MNATATTIQAEFAERLAYLLTLTHEDVNEILADEPLRAHEMGGTWWVVDFGDGRTGPGVVGEGEALTLDLAAEADREEGLPVTLTITRVPTREQVAALAAWAAAGIGAN